jgi:excisionase family DNA binding protein
VIAKEGTEKPGLERLGYAIKEVAGSLGTGRRTLERLIASGQFPGPDYRVGRCPRWTRSTVEAWVAKGGRP